MSKDIPPTNRECPTDKSSSEKMGATIGIDGSPWCMYSVLAAGLYGGSGGPGQRHPLNAKTDYPFRRQRKVFGHPLRRDPPVRSHDRVPMGLKGIWAAAAISALKGRVRIPCPFRKSYAFRLGAQSVPIHQSQQSLLRPF
jgi:hypothetical protein